MKQLILTADDFGRSPEINTAIAEAHRAGFLTQASLMVNEPAAEPAVELARQHPGLCVGLHLTLCSGLASRVSAITDHARQFYRTPAEAGLRYAFQPWLLDAVKTEIRAQFERFHALGLPATYWDGHAHLHLHPTIFFLTVPIAAEFGFRGTRLVREPGSSSPLPLTFRALSELGLPSLRRKGMKFADGVFGLSHTERMRTDVIARMLAQLPEGLSELYFHPGAEPAPIDYAALTQQLAQESILLTNLPTA